MADIVFKSEGGTNITPKWTYDTDVETITYAISGGGASGTLASGNEYDFAIGDQETITFSTDGDWSGVTQIDMPSDDVSGNISQLSTLTNLSILYFGNTNVTGDISNLSDMIILSILHFYNTDVMITSGCIDTLASLTTCRLDNCNFTQQEVDFLLASAKVNEAANPGRSVDFRIDGNNSSPSDTGMTDAYELSYLGGWTVDVNSGTSDVSISTQEELEGINTDSNTLSWNYKQVNDIRTTGDWNPIGTYADPFEGNFDGDGHKITGIYISNNTDYQGLFGFIEGTVTKLGVEAVDVDLQAGQYGGVLAGGNYGTITECYSTGIVYGDACIGGLVGQNLDTIRNCYSHAEAIADTELGGGLIGDNTSFGPVERCYSTGAVSGGDALGGLVGQDNDRVTDSYYDSETSGQSDTGKGTPKATAEMKTQSTFTNWDFDDTWYMSGYPSLEVFKKLVGIFRQGGGGQGFRGVFVQGG